MTLILRSKISSHSVYWIVYKTFVHKTPENMYTAKDDNGTNNYIQLSSIYNSSLFVFYLLIFNEISWFEQS